MAVLKRKIPFDFLSLIFLLCIGLFIQMSDYEYRHKIKNILFDNLNKTYPRAASDRVVILDIDEQSLDRPELGQWPWPRPVVAELIEKLQSYNVKVIGFDMVFAEADNTSPEQVIKAWKRRGANKDLFNDIKKLESHDKIMAKAIRASKNVVLGLNFEDRRLAGAFGFTPRPKFKFDIEDQSNLKPYIYPFDTVANYPILSRFAFGEGHFYAIPDVDGIYRRVPMVMGIEKKNIRKDSSYFDRFFFYQSLTSELLRYVAQGNKVFLGGEDNAYYIIEGKEDTYKIPVDKDSNIHVWYAKPQKEWYLSAYDVLNDKIDPQRLKDKIVLVGTSAIGLKDIRSTPMGPNRPGVEVHFNIVDQVLNNQFLSRPQYIMKFEVLITALFCLILILSSGRVRLSHQTLIMLSGIIAFFAVTNLAYAEYGLLVDGAYAALFLFLVYVAVIVVGYLSSEHDRQKIRDAFEHYISPSYMNQLTQNPEILKLGGEEKNITTMFSDIRSFTSICENLRPDEIITLMNDFLTPLTKAVMENRGTIDKYMGDAIMAFWNAPLDDEEHAYNACIAALKMLKRLERLNEKRAKSNEDLLLLRAGIGINTGLAAVGNMGSDQRFSYSVLGDSVNLASRLESQTKQYGVNILIGEACLAEPRVKDLAVLELDVLRVKGKKEPVRIFTIIGDEKITRQESFEQLLKDHNVLLSLYRSQNWSDAKKQLKPCRYNADKLGIDLDPLYAFYRHRIEELEGSALDVNWDGVYDAKTK